MKELDLLKKDWKKQEANLPKVSYEEIYTMIQKKSSSIVKWIFIIGIAEFVLWQGINFLIPEDTYDIYKKNNLMGLIISMSVLSYILTAIFLFLFYKNYKAISVAENTKTLMKKILKTRKTVNYYIYINLALVIIISLVLNIILFLNNDFGSDYANEVFKKNPKQNIFIIVFIIQFVVLAIIVLFLWLYYKLIYGILLKRLKTNYNELAKLE